MADLLTSISSAIHAVSSLFTHQEKLIHPPTKIVTPYGKFCVSRPHEFGPSGYVFPFNADYVWVKCRYCDQWTLKAAVGGAA